MLTNGEVENGGRVPDAMVKVASEVARPFKKRKIDPALKAWIDNVIVPALVRLYLAECGSSPDNGRISILERVQ